MIKVNELRLDNFVVVNKGGYCNDNTVQKVTSISKKGINSWSDMGSSGFVKEEDMTHIQLTEEWLLKFGFEKDNDFGNWHLSAYEIFSSGNRDFVAATKEDFVYWYNHSSDDYYSSVIKINTVHQLQNLYFALTGQELELK